MSKDDALLGWLAVAIAVAVFVVLLRNRTIPALLVLGSGLVSLLSFRAH